ncbi:hypothetical protein TRFO_05609 [Tritrichomonas foetus]|uniref:Uncharacterized protein n=1 Tax=Tritrichomonas foetus TaxID=1144522 RepID=A0A1J4K9M3_9EUKA|nr:hypothetical protein TRFO_05609 [Tritrichomonas foetus]|eukprot:OHT06404.1 hypothetical protein TRFO_05609 [Tritrichomonas foetus]
MSRHSEGKYSFTNIEKCFDQKKSAKRPHLDQLKINNNFHEPIKEPQKKINNDEETDTIHDHIAKVEKKSKLLMSDKINVSLITLFLLVPFLIFMLSRVYYIYNHSRTDIDLTGPKYNNTLNLESIHTNVGSLSDGDFKSFHNILITEDTPFVNFPDCFTFYPNGTIGLDYGYFEILQTNNLLFQDAIFQGSVNLLKTIGFSNHTLIPIGDSFLTSEISVGNRFHFSSHGKKYISENGTESEINPLQCDQLENLIFGDEEHKNTGNAYGYFEGSLVVLDHDNLIVRNYNFEKTLVENISTLINSTIDKLRFVNFDSSQFEYAIIIEGTTSQFYGQNNNKILDENKNEKISTIIAFNYSTMKTVFNLTDYKSVSLMVNKSLMYSTDSKTFLIPDIYADPSSPEYEIEFSPQSIGHFVSERIFGNKIAVASDVNESENSSFNNPIDIVIYGKNTIVVTCYNNVSGNYTFWKLEKDDTKTLIAEIQSNLAKAAFLPNGDLAIVYSNDFGIMLKTISGLNNEEKTDENDTLLVITEIFTSFEVINDPFAIIGNGDNFFDIIVM